MPDLVSASSLSELVRLLHSRTVETEEIALPLRILQRGGLTKSDLLVHVERIRALNDAAGEDEAVEENCLVALEIIEGDTTSGLIWNAAQRAAAWVPRVVTLERLRSVASSALSPSDLLPSRSSQEVDSFADSLAQSYWRGLQRLEYVPTSAEFFRSPKTGLTTRPAALLAPVDRFVLEALAEPVAEALRDAMPSHVRWPRGDGLLGDEYQNFVDAPLNWSSDYVLRTDVTNFYETIDHAYLSLNISRQLSLGGALPLALEAFLDAVMQSSMGLPQGPPGSDVLASSYLLDIDREIVRRGWTAARYADDFLFAAESIDEARQILRDLEEMLRDRGLSLSSDKTRILRRSTYASNLGEDDASEGFEARIVREAAAWFEKYPDSDTSPIVDEMGLPEQVQWDLLYHQSVSWADALADIQESVLPPWVHAYERVYQLEATRLEAGGHPRAVDALTVGQIKRCLLFMAADPSDAFLAKSHVMLDWHPTIVKDFSRYLSVVSEVASDNVATFIKTRMARSGIGDLEIAWLLETAVNNRDLANNMSLALKAEAQSEDRPLAATLSVRALVGAGLLDRQEADGLASRWGQALGAELVLSMGITQSDLPMLGTGQDTSRADVGSPF